MPKKKKRDAGYYRDRLKREHPAIYGDLFAGRITSVRQAAAKAGLIRLPKPLDALKQTWKRATATEHRKFLEWLRDERGLRRRSSVAIKSLPKVITGPDGHLLPEVVDRVRCLMGIRCLRMGEAKTEMGLSANDSRLSEALGRKKRPAPEVVEALEAWLLKGSIRL